MVSKKSHAAHKSTSKSGGSSPTGPISDITPGQNPKLVLQNLNKDQLRKELKRRGIKASGNKSELFQRLQHNMHSPLKKRTEPQSSGGSNNTSIGNHHKSNGDSSRKTGPKDMVQNRSRQQEKEERETLVLWRRPLLTLNYFIKETWFSIVTYGETILQHKLAFISVVLSCILSYAMFHLPGPHQKHLLSVWAKVLWCLYWLGLGVLSSVGLGTGLHTFILYLGPHIASVTLAAYECGGLNFPEPPYPDEIVCPTEVDPRWTASIWNIMSKVRLEGVMWGAGTALGELPPYFMARAARLSGYDPEDEEDLADIKDDLAEFEELQRKKDNPELLSTMDRLKLFVEKLVEKVGFFGILACASIPNPLFDLAGITCGHFLVPFWTFFGATLLGKAVIKMHIQKIFVIVAFNEALLEKAVALLGSLPVIGNRLEKPFTAFLQKQKERLHRKGVDSVTSADGSLLSSIFEKFVIAMILYFIVSIVNSLAQSHHKRLHSKHRGSKKSKD